MNILLLNLPTKFFIHPLDSGEYFMNINRKFIPNPMKNFAIHNRTANEVYRFANEHGNVDFFDLDARLVKKYIRVDDFLDKLDMRMFLDEIQLKYNEYDYLLFSLIREPGTGADYIFDLQTRFAFIVIEHLKKMFPNAKVILGGSGFGYSYMNKSFHRSSYPTFIDYVHSNHLNKEIMGYIMEGRYKDIYNFNPPPFPPSKAYMPTNADDYKYITDEIFNFFDIKEKLNAKDIIMAETTLLRGCPGRCAFCVSAPEKVRFMDFDILKDMIMSYLDSGINSFFFLDDCINPIAEKFCNWIIKDNLKFYFMDGSRHNLNPDYYSMLYEAGCRSLHFGIETSDNDTLKYIQKGFTNEEMVESLKLSHDAGIWNVCSVIINLPYSKPDNNIETFKFLLEHREYIQSVSPFQFVFFPYSLFAFNPEKFGLKYIKLKNKCIWREINGRGYTDIMENETKNFLTDDIINSDMIHYIPYHLLFTLYDHYDDKTEVVKFLQRNNLRD